ncbi:MAG: tRNA 2-thiouridine(34) synthase MnmA [Omnitrophica bacterium GWA2_41_15]|nr:MAG: tRNA 2-thiouridine(34) synthase MnmA [Omnitrophica bacterium GWA2_41_15]HAZ10932.1 tRNA 2-thiouridine(34) synthase MnmA [Candidatus Omnitrophota bacterium]
MKNKRVLVAMSGGVDSSVAAAILNEAGYEVIGATMKVWPKELCGKEKEKACCSLKDIEDARKVSRVLGIKHYVLNLEADFQKNVIDYFVKEYLAGKTPNPCIVCNEKIKFGSLLKKAIGLGCNFIATGHYARIEMEPTRANARGSLGGILSPPLVSVAGECINGSYGLRESVDKAKDQSYVLFCLKQSQLKKILFPIGNFTKDDIRRKAKELELNIYDKPDSQEICFVPDNNYSDFIKKYRNIKPQKGNIIDRSGKALGNHMGFWNFTIGQRRGLGIAAKEPLYVTEIRPKHNIIVVGAAEDVKKKRFLVKKINWLAKDTEKEKDLEVKIRYNHKKAWAYVKDLGGNIAEVDFKEPQSAITPGQAAVFYDGEYVSGGGWIDKILS